MNLLSLRIGDVYQNRRAVTDLLFDKSIVKGKETSRAVPVNRDGRAAIDELIDWHREKYGNTASTRPLFPSRNGQGEKQMSRRTAHDVLKDAFEAAGLNGHLATHSLRKSFAQRLYDRTGDIFAVQEMLGHRNVATTQKYLGVNYASVRAAVEEMAVSSVNCTQPPFWAVRSKKRQTKPSSSNSHSAGTTSPVCGTRRRRRRLLR